MTQPTCETCRLWFRSSEKFPAGQCRANAPERDGVMNGARWPYTAAKDWCGEHQPREAAVEPIPAPMFRKWAKPKEREPLPHWVLPKHWNRWTVAIASIQPGAWFLPGEDGPLGDEDMEEIDERPIRRSPP